MAVYQSSTMLYLPATTLHLQIAQVRLSHAMSSLHAISHAATPVLWMAMELPPPGPRPTQVSARQHDVDSSRQKHERDWQHLERCLEAPSAHKSFSFMRGGVTRVAYQGHAGAYSHAVVEEVYGPGAEAIPCGDFTGAFSAVESRYADQALIPIENSLDGSIHRNYDLLLRHHLHIVAELPWKVRHCLLARPGASPAQLRRVVGHPQALSHCYQTLATLGFSEQSFHPSEDMAAAALNIEDSTALVASSKAAPTFGLHILSEGIQDDPDNITRFLLLSREPLPPPSLDLPCKTTLAFALYNGLSDLCDVMLAFALGGIKVLNLVNRPALLQHMGAEGLVTRGLAAEQFKYVFVVDIETSLGCPRVKAAVQQVQNMSSYFKILGSYPVL